MTSIRLLVVCICATTALAVISCKKDSTTSRESDRAAAPAATGIEKVKPAPETGNVQGKVLYNGKPVENIEIKLCETFSRFLGGGCGKTFIAPPQEERRHRVT